MLEAKKTNIPDESVETPSKANKNIITKFKELVNKIISYMKTLIKDVIEMFENTFSNKEEIDKDSYLASETGKLQFDYDCYQVEEKVHAEIRKGRKIIQAISKGTGIDDATVEHYVDSTADIIKNNKEVIVLTGVGFALWKRGSKKLKDTSKELDSAEKDIARVAESVANDPKKQKAINKVLNAMRAKVKVGTDAIKHYGTKLSKTKKESKDKKEENK